MYINGGTVKRTVLRGKVEQVYFVSTKKASFFLKTAISVFPGPQGRIIILISNAPI